MEKHNVIRISILVISFCVLCVGGQIPINFVDNPCGTLPDDYSDDQTNGVPLPWVVRIRYPANDRGSRLLSLCTGSLIDRRYVLTAAHCIVALKDLPVDVEIRDCEENTPNCENSTFVYNIQQMKAHPEYSIRDRINDIALIRLAENVDFTKTTIRAACLLESVQPPLSMTDRMFFVSGYGIHKNGTAKTKYDNQELRTAVVPSMDSDKCQALYDRMLMTIDPKRQLCAGGKGEEPCLGDGGAPLHAVFGRRMIQVGLVSVGPAQCGNDPQPTIYTRVMPHMQWIMDTEVEMQLRKRN